MQIESRRMIAQAVNEVLQSPYHDEKMCLKILTSFLAPENHAIKGPKPPIPHIFTFDRRVYPTGKAKIDSVYELFTVLDENGEISNFIINRKLTYFLKFCR